MRVPRCTSVPIGTLVVWRAAGAKNFEFLTLKYSISNRKSTIWRSIFQKFRRCAAPQVPLRGQVLITKPPLIQRTCKTKGGFCYKGGVLLQGYVLMFRFDCVAESTRNRKILFRRIGAVINFIFRVKETKKLEQADHRVCYHKWYKITIG